MQFKQYPSYKNSGVEWLGDVPDEWDIYPFWHLFNRKEITNKTQEQLLSVYLDRGVILHSEGGGMVHKPADNLEKYQLVEVNDFVMNNQQAWRGSVGVSPYKGIVSPAYLIFSFNKKICAPKFFKYFLRDKGVVDQFMIASMSVGTIQRQVKWHLLKTIQLSIPSLIEQNTIANFLDTETARIDNLISKQEKLIELLEEQRKSIISHAVTKGLNPNAPMKDSGVEWLGEVPEDWEVKRFGYIFTENKKKNIGLIETNVLSLSYGNIKEKNIDDNKGLLPESFETYQIIEPNDIVFRFTDLQNDKRSLRNAISKYHGIITSAYIGVKTKENADFYNYLFRAYDLQKVFYSMGDGMRQSLKMDELNKMPIVLPKIEAQERIVKFINEENQRINNLVVKQKNLIEKLKEYRASIISHAVTGKIDVREFGA